MKADDLALKPIRAEKPKTEPPVEEKPAADKPVEKPAEAQAAKAVTIRDSAEKSKDVGPQPAQPKQQPDKSDQKRMVGN